MKHLPYIAMLLLYCWAWQVFGQNQTLFEIIKSGQSIEIKQKKIDSLLTISVDDLPKARLADMYHDLGLHWYYGNWAKTGDGKYLLDAIAHTKKAALLKAKLDPLDSISLKRSLYNLGFLEKSNGNLYASLKSHLKLVQMGGRDNRIKEAHQELGNTYAIMGDYKKAVDHLQTALFLTQNDSRNFYEIATAHIDLAKTFSLMGYVKHADEIMFHLHKADSLSTKSAAKNAFVKARIKQMRGNLMLMLKNYQMAIQQHLAALEYVKLNEKKVPLLTLKHSLSTIHNSLGKSYSELDETEKAFAHFKSALSANDIFSSPYENMGDFYVDTGEFEKGLLHYERAIALLTGKNLEVDHRSIPTLEDLELSREKTLLLGHLVSKANGWCKYYKYDSDRQHLVQALETFASADQLIDLIRFESTEQQSKLYWRERSADLYMKAVEVCHLLNRPQEAYYFMERNKALLLLEDLTQEEAKKIAKMPDTLAQREFNLKRAILLSENVLQESIGRFGLDSIAGLKQAVFDHKYRYERFMDSLEQSYPDYAKFKKKVAILPFEDLEAGQVSQNQATLHYTLNHEVGYGLLTTINGPQLFQLESVAELNEQVEEVIGMLSDGLSNIDSLKSVSNAVFQKLFPKDVFDKIKGKHLTVIPDYILQQLPFEALVTDTAEAKYLIEEVTVGYAYSASLLDYNFSDKEKAPDGLLAVSPVTFGVLDLPELYFSKKEVEALTGILSGKPLLHNQANKDNFIKNAKDYGILHLATHADVGKGGNPWIAFSDSKMYLKEIYATKTGANMVVLSACNTSSGELKRGEGVMSLARGFFYSGAKSVVSTLWPVSDESGKDLLVNFYKNLKLGLSKSKALQKAKLDFLKNTDEKELKHPYYWAGFVVLGDNSPISDKPNYPWIPLGLVLLGTGIMVFGYKKVKAHRATS